MCYDNYYCIKLAYVSIYTGVIIRLEVRAKLIYIPTPPKEPGSPPQFIRKVFEVRWPAVLGQGIYQNGTVFINQYIHMH